MTDVQINKEIAEACGWKDVWKCEIASEDAPFVGTSPDGKFIPVTDYVNDLNARFAAVTI